MMGWEGLWKSFHFYFFSRDFRKQFVKLSCFEIKESEGVLREIV
jgi:hypothetical protein